MANSTAVIWYRMQGLQLFLDVRFLQHRVELFVIL